jgi:hypothetical protein
MAVDKEALHVHMSPVLVSILVSLFSSQTRPPPPLLPAGANLDPELRPARGGGGL